MKICVLNGSPKGKESITLQYVRFLELAFPAHTFVVEDVGQRIGALEAKEEEFRKVIASIDAADAILFATPVYYLLVPAQFKRFIELLFSHNTRSAFLGKYAASLTTSIHFFDHTANEYLHAVAEDLGMRWTGSFMAKMDDLLRRRTRRTFSASGRTFSIQHKDTRPYGAPILRSAAPSPSTAPRVSRCRSTARGKQVLILTDAAPGSNLEKMTTRLASCFGKSASLVPIDDAKMNGGCLGCCRCAFDNTCVYTDGFSEFWKETVLPADIIIFAGTVKDRYLSAAFKQVFDRSFFLGHVPSFDRKAGGFPYRRAGCAVRNPAGELCGHMSPTRVQTLPGLYRMRSGSPWQLTSRSMPLPHGVSAFQKAGTLHRADFPAVAGQQDLPRRDLGRDAGGVPGRPRVLQETRVL